MFRRHGRTAIQCPILLKHPILGDLSGVTRDVSVSGIFIAAVQSERDSALPPVKVGEMLEAEIERTDSEVELIQLKVIRYSHVGFGLAFVHH